VATTWKIRRTSLFLGHGFSVLFLSMGLFVTSAVMSSGVFEEIGYKIATALTAVGLVIPATFFLVALRGPRQNRRMFTNLSLAAATVMCWFILWTLQSSPADIHLVVTLAGLQGILWSLGYMKIAFSLRAYPRRATYLCVTAAATSFAGIVVATQPALTVLNAVTAAASFNLFVGVQVVLTAAYLYRQIATLAEAELQPTAARRELAPVYVSRALIDEESLLS
jgi:hypothetical protein